MLTIISQLSLLGEGGEVQDWEENGKEDVLFNTPQLGGKVGLFGYGRRGSRGSMRKMGVRGLQEEGALSWALQCAG